MNLKQDGCPREISCYRDIAIHWGNKGDALYRLADDEDASPQEVIDCLQRILNCKGSSSFIFQDTNWDDIEAFIAFAQKQLDIERITASLERLIKRMKKIGITYREGHDLTLDALSRNLS